MAALYLSLALLAAIPYFLLVVDYPGATTAAEKVALIADHYASMYVVYLATYLLFGIAIGVLALALHSTATDAAVSSTAPAPPSPASTQPHGPSRRSTTVVSS